jgi:hypothetical protein
MYFMSGYSPGRGLRSGRADIDKSAKYIFQRVRDVRHMVVNLVHFLCALADVQQLARNPLLRRQHHTVGGQDAYR